MDQMKGSASSSVVGDVPRGLFSPMGTRGMRSAEAQVMKKQPLDRSEIQSVSDLGTAILVETKNGRFLWVSPERARQNGYIQ